VGREKEYCVVIIFPGFYPLVVLLRLDESEGVRIAGSNALKQGLWKFVFLN
jgi:hypothetical protein